MTADVWVLIIALIELVMRVVDFVIDKIEKLPSDDQSDKEPQK
ncbi:hypothetical protein [Raoultibacter phocaeensis]|nr:hypothetical protein [Raoultibacter phocaeensis]